MRYTIGDVVRRPTLNRIAGWWYDLPARSRLWWSEVLFDPGQGWLRWGIEQRVDYSFVPPDVYIVAPPLRRLWFRIWWPRWSIRTLVSEDREALWR